MCARLGSTALPPRLESGLANGRPQPGRPPPVYSIDEFDAALAHVMREPSRLALLDYMPPEGHAHYRAMGAKWLARSGIDISETNVIVTSGAHLGVMACLRFGAARRCGDGRKSQLRLLGSDLRPQLGRACHECGGACLDDWNTAKPAGKILYLVLLQIDLTVSRSRDAVVDIARYNLTIVEDDIFRLLDDRCGPRHSTVRRNALISPACQRRGQAFASAATPPGAQFLRLRQRAAEPGSRAYGRFALWLKRISPNTWGGHCGDGNTAQYFRDVFPSTFSCEPGAPMAGSPFPALEPFALFGNLA
jgi:hypothetical protein